LQQRGGVGVARRVGRGARDAGLQQLPLAVQQAQVADAAGAVAALRDAFGLVRPAPRVVVGLDGLRGAGRFDSL
jgi:hypothetical protein